VILDASTWRILLDETPLAADGVLQFSHLPNALAALMPNLTHLEALIELEYLAKVFELPHWSHVHKLKLNTMVEKESHHSISCRHVFGQIDRAALKKMTNVKSLNVSSDGQIGILAGLLPLPPNLTKLEITAREFCSSENPPSFPPTLTDISLSVSPEHLISEAFSVGQLPLCGTNQFEKFDIQGSVFTFQALMSHLSPNARYIACALECFDHEVPLLVAHVPNAVLDLKICVLVSGTKASAQNSNLIARTAKFVRRSVRAANEANNIQICDMSYSGPLHVEKTATSISLDGGKECGFMTNFRLGPLPSVVVFSVSGVSWEMVRSAVCESPSLGYVHVTLLPHDGFMMALSEQVAHSEPTTAPKSGPDQIVLAGDFSSIEHFTMIAKPKIGWDPHLIFESKTWSKLTTLTLLSLSWLDLHNSKLKEVFMAMTKLQMFNTDAMDDSSLWWLFGSHPSIASIILGTLRITGSLLPSYLTSLSRSNLVSTTLDVLEVQFRLTYSKLELTTPLALSGLLLSEKGPLVTLEWVDAPDGPGNSEKSQRLGAKIVESTPLPHLFSQLPLSLVSVDFRLAGPTTPLMSLKSTLAVLKPLKALEKLRIDCQVTEEYRSSLRLTSQDLPPNLVSLSLPTAKTDKRTGIIFQPPPSLTEFDAPMLMLDVRYPIPKTITIIRVANLDRMPRHSSEPNLATPRSSSSKAKRTTRVKLN
jgi:hypothetical protein